MSDTCIFCRIARGEAPARLVYQDERFTAFHDAAPQAPLHILIIPNRHMTNLNEALATDAGWLGELLLLARQLAAEMGLAEPGYRLVLNTGRQAGQSVHHLHLHLLGGRRLGWPPG